MRTNKKRLEVLASSQHAQSFAGRYEEIFTKCFLREILQNASKHLRHVGFHFVDCLLKNKIVSDVYLTRLNFGKLLI